MLVLNFAPKHEIGIFCERDTVTIVMVQTMWIIWSKCNCYDPHFDYQSSISQLTGNAIGELLRALPHELKENVPVLIQKRARVKGTVIPVVKLLHRVPVHSPAQFVSPCYTVTAKI